MSKAILILDMPESCDDCPLLSGYYVDIYCGGKQNRVINNPYPKDFRQDWCPLKEVPEKEKNDDPVYDNDEYDDGFITGWNACIDDILGE